MLDGKRAYICSPLSATTKEVRQQNMEKAKFYLMQIKRLYHCRTFASHAHLPLMLDDEIPEEREAALQIGMILLTLCDVLVVCGPYISAGMAGEIRRDAFMIRKLRIAVDHGNKNMKTCNQVFTTALITQDKKPARGEEYIFYEGKYYLLSNRRIPYQRDKTEDERFFVLTLFAIVKELKKYPQIAPEDVLQINLSIGLPPKHFADLCEKYECYFKGENKVHEIITEGGTYHVAIHDVMAFPQDYAAMMTVIDKLQDIPKSIGIDIGGFTTDYLLMRKGMPDMESCDSLERGVITMYNQVISGVNSEYDILLEECDVDSILKGNTEFYEPAVVKMTEGIAQDFVTDLLSSIRERGIDTRSTYTVFIGGGAALLKKLIEKSDRLGKYMFIEDICANAKGYDKLYQMMTAEE